jgi:hypothetical protein
MVPGRKKKRNIICKRKNLIKCQAKKEPTNPTLVAENLFMDFVHVCKMPTDVKYWQVAGPKDVIN